MCATCGCSGQADDHVPGAQHRHGHSSGDGSKLVRLERDLLAKNDHIAQHNRVWLAEHGVAAVNVMSSPGAGKTTLLERTARDLAAEIPIAVVEGDQETHLDADRIEAAGVPVVQVNTGVGCHLDAEMVQRALASLDPPRGSLVFVENVGNLVCPALFDLGEHRRAVVMSTTEGADKPTKYPRMFAGADLVLLNKVDLLPYLDFDIAAFRADLSKVSPRADVLPVAATTGAGLDGWYTWLRGLLDAVARRQPEQAMR
jgi:hydrogenase nickel incorporation protein HypB